MRLVAETVARRHLRAAALTWSTSASVRMSSYEEIWASVSGCLLLAADTPGMIGSAGSGPRSCRAWEARLRGVKEDLVAGQASWGDCEGRVE